MKGLSLLTQIAACQLPEPQTEVKFHPKRKWRFDLAWPDRKLACEIDGGGFIGGRHSTGMGIQRDCEKGAAALLLGWRVLRVTPAQVRSGEALNWIESLLMRCPHVSE